MSFLYKTVPKIPHPWVKGRISCRRIGSILPDLLRDRSVVLRKSMSLLFSTLHLPAKYSSYFSSPKSVSITGCKKPIHLTVNQTDAHNTNYCLLSVIYHVYPVNPVRKVTVPVFDDDNRLLFQNCRPPSTTPLR